MDSLNKKADHINSHAIIYFQQPYGCMEDGVILSKIIYNNFFAYLLNFSKGYRLLADRIGTYPGCYDMGYPLIVKKYYYENTPGVTITKAIDFCMIHNG